MLFEREIGHQAFESDVLLLPPAAVGGVRSRPDARTSFPSVEGGVADAELSAVVTNRDSTLGLPAGIDDLLFREL